MPDREAEGDVASETRLREPALPLSSGPPVTGVRPWLLKHPGEDR